MNAYNEILNPNQEGEVSLPSLIPMVVEGIFFPVCLFPFSQGVSHFLLYKAGKILLVFLHTGPWCCALEGPFLWDPISSSHFFDYNVNSLSQFVYEKGLLIKSAPASSNPVNFYEPCFFTPQPWISWVSEMYKNTKWSSTQENQGGKLYLVLNIYGLGHDFFPS